MSASPQANQGLDDGAPLPAAYVPSHTAVDSDDDHASDNDGAAPAKLSQIERHADENDVKDEQGEPSDDQPEDTGDDPQQDLDPEAHPARGEADEDDKDNVAAAATTATGKGEAEDDDEEDDEDEVSRLLHSTPECRLVEADSSRPATGVGGSGGR